MQTVVDILTQMGPLGLVLGLLVAVAVYLLEFTDLLPSGNARRTAAIVISALLAPLGQHLDAATILGLITLITSTLLHMAQDWLVAYLRAHTITPVPGIDTQ